MKCRFRIKLLRVENKRPVAIVADDSDSFQTDVLLAFAENVIAAFFVGTAIFVHAAFRCAALEQRFYVILQ